MLFAHGSLFLLRTPLAVMLPWSPNNEVFESVWLTVLSLLGRCAKSNKRSCGEDCRLSRSRHTIIGVVIPPSME
jgi:hypothetical protein